MIKGHQLERCQRSLPLGMIALQAAHASAHLGQAIVPALAFEQIPKRVRIEDADVPARARDLHRVMAAGDIETAAARVDESPTHYTTNENKSGTMGKRRTAERREGKGRVRR